MFRNTPPTMNSQNIFVSIINADEQQSFFLESPNTNIELSAFCSPETLDTRADELVSCISAAMQGSSRRLTLHGPVKDLAYESSDLKIRAVAKERIVHGLSIAAALKAEVLVAHSTFNPLHVFNNYPASWVEKSIAFWREIIPIAQEHKVRVVFENIWDPTPDAMLAVIRAINSEYFKVCIDTGHLNIFSKVSIEEWVTQCGKDLTYVHLHNNNGVLDEHCGLDEGTFDFACFFNALKKESIDPILTLELRHRAALTASMERLEQLWQQ